MRIALINPKGTIFSKNKKLADFLEQSVTMGSFRHFWSAPCLGLLTVAAYIPPEWEIAYIDENYKDIDFDQSYDIVCLSAMTVQIVRAYEIAEIFKGKGSLTVIGGVHATVVPYEALKYADVVIAGEGEALFSQFVKDFINKTCKRLYKEDDPGVFDLHRCISPQYELIENYDYPIINIYTTRGCPRKCNFCCASNVYGTKYRSKDNEEILREIHHIGELYPNKLLLFADDNLFGLRKKSKQLMKGLIQKKIRWIAQTDISIADDHELLELMAQAGCQWIVIGFESVSETSLKNLEAKNFKYQYVSHYHEKINKIQSYGIGVYGTFIVGLDEDTEDIFDKTADFILKQNLCGANITVPTPLPGTKLRHELLRKNRVVSNRWDDYTLWDVVIHPKRMSKKVLEGGLLYTYQRITRIEDASSRLSNLMKTIRQSHKQGQRRI